MTAISIEAINRKEVMRYLGYRSLNIDENVLKMVEKAQSELLSVYEPRVVYKTYDVEEIEKNHLKIGLLDIKSKDLYQHLNSCTKAVVLGATIGIKVDKLIQKANVLDVSYAVTLQASAAALIEQVCDVVQSEIEQEQKAFENYLRPRFSPGYGDFSLDHQTTFLSMLDAQKKIGLTLMKSNIMAPSKSVTAIIGLTKDGTTCHISHCMTCKAKNCPFRIEI